jgi:hypothetical protein
VIETRPIAPGELEMAKAEERRDRKRELIMQVLRNVIDDLYNWLNTKERRHASALHHCRHHRRID